MKIKAHWASHLPVLIKTLERTTGPVLELGGGLFSTPYLHWMCHVQNRRLITYDHVERYYEFEKQLANEMHDVIFVEDWDKVEFNDYYGVVFADHAPAERRVVEIERLKDKADFIVVHDTELRHEYEYNYKSIYPLFRWNVKYREAMPHTSVLSNKYDPRELGLWT